VPYFIKQTAEGWDTVKDDGTVLGKHKTKSQAIKQMVAVSIAEKIAPGGELKRAVPAGDYQPPAGVAVAAKRAIKWIEEGKAGSGFTAVGRRRASQLASGGAVSADVVNRMISYFARHAVDKQATGFNSGEDGFPSAGRVAWDAWGGDAGESWVNGLNERYRNELDLSKSETIEVDERNMDEYMPLTKEQLVAKVQELQGEVLELVGHLVETVSDLGELVEATVEPVTPVEDELPVEVKVDAVRFVEPVKVAELHERGERVEQGIERRELHDLELRVEGDGMTLTGYAAVFNSASQPLPFIERIEPGAFRDSLKSRNDVKLLWNHDTNIVLGSTRAGTLRLTEDERGLRVEAQLPPTQAGKDAAISIQRGDVTGFSFGFRVPVGGDEWPSASERVLKRVNVHEVSVGVAFPAYLGTEGSATVRSMIELPELIAKLAELRGVSAEELTEALLALEAGQELTERQGELLTETLSKVLTKDEQVNNASALLDLKKKELDLLMKRV